MKITNKRYLFYILFGLGVLWLTLAYILQRDSFVWRDGRPFDWAGLVYMLLTVIIATVGFWVLSQSQKLLRFHYALYGVLWIVPIIFLSSDFATTYTDLNAPPERADVHQYCAPDFLPRVCHYNHKLITTDDGMTTNVPVDTTFQAGYLAMFVLYISLAFAAYRSLKKYIKKYKNEELFQ